MDKRKPTHALAAFQAAFARHRAITAVARRDAAALDLTVGGVAEIVARMERRQFVKSTTGFVNHRQWHDVYHVPWNGMTLYVKFTDSILTEFVLLSFKGK